MGNKAEQIDSLRRYANLIQKQTGRVVRPYRMDGYVNLMNKYGTSRDTSERYEYQQEPMVPDDLLTMYYENNGLLAKIIDSPAEEAIKHGFILKDLKDQNIEDFYVEALDDLDWEENVMTAVKWARLFGGAIAVMMIDDGRGLEEPLDWKNIRSVDDIRIYDRSLVHPDMNGMFSYNPDDPFNTRGSRLGMPEYYDVYSRYGSFRVHDSRCLIFQNGRLPENSSNSVYQFWGMPEYIRLKRAIRDAELAHGTAPKLLDRSVQAVYKMKGLADELATEEGENRVLRRLQIIDMARGLLNSIAIDNEGEDYDFRTFTFTGVSDVIESTCNFLSALTCIPQTILFGRSPAGMNSTGESDLENWYNYLERIQKRMIRKNLRYLLSIIFQAGVYTKEIDEVPPIKVEFNPLWSLSEQERADLEATKASIQQTKAATAQIYVEMQALSAEEVRKKLADSEEFDVEAILDEVSEEELEENDPANNPQAVPGQEAAAPQTEAGNAPKAPQKPSAEEENKDDETAVPFEDSLKNAWEGVTPENQTVEDEPKDSLKNAWEGTTEVQEAAQDTLRNAWLGINPGDPMPEGMEKPDHGTMEPDNPNDTLRNAWLGISNQNAEYPDDAYKDEWLGIAPEHTEWGVIRRSRPEDKHVRTYKEPKRDYRAAGVPQNPAKAPEIVPTEEDTQTHMDAGKGGAVGVYVVKDGKVLTGIRGKGDGEFLVCGPGGHIEEGETPGQAAIRETQEEFGITPMELIFIGKGEKQTNGLQPDLFLCVRYEGTPECDDNEMHSARFTPVEEIETSGRLFGPFESGFKMLKEKICNNA